jgi:putative glycosyltransferase (TIGR04372 family)
MQEIVDRGGWVIRVGDPTMKPIPSMKNVIDYAHLNVKSDWMDVFLCASCKFFIGCSSGLRHLAGVFGNRIVSVNTAAPFLLNLIYDLDGLSIPKLIWLEKEKRYISFREILSSPIADFYEDYTFAANNIKVVENSPEDIKGVVTEMLDKVEGKLQYSKEDECLQDRFKSLIKTVCYSKGVISRVGRDFLKKYEYLI